MYTVLAIFLLQYEPKRLRNWKRFWLEMVGYRLVKPFHYSSTIHTVVHQETESMWFCLFVKKKNSCVTCDITKIFIWQPSDSSRKKEGILKHWEWDWKSIKFADLYIWYIFMMYKKLHYVHKYFIKLNSWSNLFQVLLFLCTCALILSNYWPSMVDPVFLSQSIVLVTINSEN